MTNIERDILNKHPEVARAAVILSNAKSEAANVVKGNSEEDIARREDIQKKLIIDMVNRDPVLQNGKSETDRSIS